MLEEFFGFRNQAKSYFMTYLYADTVAYVVYLIQFPLIAVFVRLLHSNYDDRKTLRSYKSKQRQLPDDSANSIMNRTYSEEIEIETLNSNQHNHAELECSTSC